MINIANTPIPRKRKSEKLTPEEKDLLKTFVDGFDTIVEAAETIGIHRNVLDLVLVKGSGSPETISKVRTALSEATNVESNLTTNS